jgi:hypothetical protein
MSYRVPRSVRRALILTTAVLCGVAATSSTAQAATSPSGADCQAPSLLQPFAAFNDMRAYALAPGGSFDDAVAAGWGLTGGARIVPGTSTRSGGSVLDLPSGSKAVSPVMCVTSDYPVARMWVRNVVGAEGVFFYVSYVGTKTWDTPKNTGQVHGKSTSWTLSDPVNVQPNGTSGWQKVRFTLIPGGKTSDFQVDDFYVDPRLSR